MNELEYRAGRASLYREVILGDNNKNPISWCLLVGLWETASWICNKNTENPPMLEWLELGDRSG